MSEVHVLPLNDLLAHDETDECACLPWTEYANGGWVVTHNAWDGRP